MDIINTVKVSNIRAAAAYKKALADFDAALPVMQAVAEEKDAETLAEYKKEMAEWRERVFGKDEKRLAWAEYDKAYAEWDRPGFFRARPAAPVAPDFPRPPKYGNYGYDPIPTMHAYLGLALKHLDDLREGLKNKLAMASVALGPYRVDAKTAVFISDCEDGSYVARLKAGYEAQRKEVDE